MSADLLIIDAHLATMVPGDDPYGAIHDGALLITDGRLQWVGPRAELPAVDAREVRSAGGAWITPGLIDCHTHLVYAGDRSGEWEDRLNGASYADIARRGGGIRATVAATRAASEDELVTLAARRLRGLRDDGVTTVEIKSGYGLDLPTERRMLRAARRLAPDVRVVTTFLGAHAVPPEAASADAYVDHLVADVLPALHAEALVDHVDAFCETIGFSPAQVRRLFDAATRLGLPVKLHAEQLSDSDGAALVAAYGGLSADHLEWLSDAGVAAMAAAGTVAVLLPGAFYALRETKLPPIAALRTAGVPMAIATDHNPGTSPVLSLRLAAHLAITLFGLTPAEALAGVTRHAARALGLADVGQLRTGFRADLAAWDVDRPAAILHGLGGSPLRWRHLGR
jgi:imidazolonepropionase